MFRWFNSVMTCHHTSVRKVAARLFPQIVQPYFPSARCRWLNLHILVNWHFKVTHKIRRDEMELYCTWRRTEKKQDCTKFCTKSDFMWIFDFFKTFHHIWGAQLKRAWRLFEPDFIARLNTRGFSRWSQLFVRWSFNLQSEIVEQVLPPDRWALHGQN